MKTQLLGRAARGVLVVCLLWMAGCSDKSVDNDIEIPPPPAGVTDLRVTTVAPDWADLAWTAPSADESHGPASYYDIRYTDFDPGESDWDNATRVAWSGGTLPGGFTESIRVTGLTSGATYYFALKCCDNNNQSSPISNLAEATLPVEFPVTFPDPALEAAIRNALTQSDGAIMYSAVLGIVDLWIESKGVSNLTGLEYCENLQYLFLLGNDVTDVEPISDLQNLRMINLNDNHVVNLSPLSGLTGVEQLHLGFNGVVEIGPLASLTGVAVLTLSDNQIVEITALTGLTNLQELNLSHNQIIDLAPLAANTGLGEGDTVYLTGNPLSEVSLDTHIPALQARGVTVEY